nr:hypothetical protein [Ammonifex degensii]
MLDQITAENRANCGSNKEGYPHNSHSHIPLGRRKSSINDTDSKRHDHSAAQSLKYPKKDESIETPRQPAEKGTDGKQTHAD